MLNRWYFSPFDYYVTLGLKMQGTRVFETFELLNFFRILVILQMSSSISFTICFIVFTYTITFLVLQKRKGGETNNSKAQKPTGNETVAEEAAR